MERKLAMNWIEVIQNLGAFLIGSGILGYFGKNIFEYYLDRSIDKYRLLLDKERQEYMQQLQLITQKHQIQYSKLHNDRADVIKLLYQKLVTMEQSMRDYMSPIRFGGEYSREQMKELAGKAAQEFFNYFSSNEIFFDKTICTLIGEMHKLYLDAWVEFTIYDDEATREAVTTDRDLRKERAKVWKSTWDKIDMKIPPIKDKLKNQFRDLLGVINDH